MEIAGQKLDGLSFEKLQKAYQEWLKQQPAPIEVLMTGVVGSLQGLAIGYFLGKFGTPDPSTVNAGANPALNAQLQALQSGGPWAQARNLGTLTGVQQALSLAIKKARGGTDDVYTAMGASFGGGVAYSLVSGAPNPLQSAITTGMAFALFNGLFYQLGNWNPFKPEHPDTAYERGKYMLATLGLQKYSENLKKQLLTDQTIMLWNDGALADASIPAGPRLLILHHLDGYRNPAAVLKPALPLPPMPPPPQAAQAGAQR